MYLTCLYTVHERLQYQNTFSKGRNSDNCIQQLPFHCPKQNKVHSNIQYLKKKYNKQLTGIFTVPSRLHTADMINGYALHLKGLDGETIPRNKNNMYFKNNPTQAKIAVTIQLT